MKAYTWRAAIVSSDLPATTRHVLLTLSLYINEMGQSAYPSIERLSKETGLTERAVGTHLRNARDSGWLKVGKFGFGDQRWATNCYFPTLPDGFEYEEREIERLKGQERGSSPSTKGQERGSKGQERGSSEVRNDVPTNYPVELSSELPSKTYSAAAPSKYSALVHLQEIGVDPQIASDWLQVRKTKKAAATKTAIDGVLREIERTGLTPDAGLRICCERGWAGFKGEWIANQQQPQQSAWQQKQSQQQDLINRIRGGSNAARVLKDIN